MNRRGGIAGVVAWAVTGVFGSVLITQVIVPEPVVGLLTGAIGSLLAFTVSFTKMQSASKAQGAEQAAFRIEVRGELASIKEDVREVGEKVDDVANAVGIEGEYGLLRQVDKLEGLVVRIDEEGSTEGQRRLGQQEEAVLGLIQRMDLINNAMGFPPQYPTRLGPRDRRGHDG